MKTPLQSLRLLVLLGALPASAVAQRDAARIDTTLAIAKGGTVRLGNVSGEIRVSAENRPDVRLRADMERGSFETSYTGSRISVTTRSVEGRQSSARFDVVVPVGTRVDVSTISGRVTVRDTQGEVTVRSTSGTVEVREAKDRLEVNTVSGGIDVQRTTGRTRLEAVSGGIRVDEAVGELSAETVSGSIAVRRSRLEILRAAATSGSVSYEGTLSRSGSYRLNAHSGSVTLAIPANSHALLELETFSGRIYSDFPLTLQPGETGGRRGRRMEFTLGDGGARVTAGAFSGSITIRRGAATTNRE